MEEREGRTIVLGDARGDGHRLRVTWHPGTSVFVFSHWAGPVCTASTRVRLDEATEVVGLVVEALRGTIRYRLGQVLTHPSPA